MHSDLALQAGLAALPIVTILVMILGFRASAAVAGWAGLLVALPVAWTAFGFGTALYPGAGPVAVAAGAMVEAVFVAATILWIIVPALCIYELQRRTGALEVLQASIGRISDDPRIVVIMVAWFFALFMEGAAAFGSTIALAAPFLVGYGYRPVEAIAIVLVGHAVGASFGALGTPVIPMTDATGLSPVTLSAAIGLYHGLLGWLLLGAVMFYSARALQADGTVAPRGGWGWTVLAAVLFLAPFYMISRFVGPELSNMVGAAAGGLMFVLLYRTLGRPGTLSRVASAPATALKMPVLRAAAPYLILIALVLVTRLIPPVREVLSRVVWEWSLFDIFGASFQPLYQPGTLLFAALVLGALVKGARLADVGAAVGQSLRQVAPVSVALVAMLGVSQVMDYARMIDSLATAAAALAGGSWPLVAPFVGVLGTFMTGSATASNILFTELQETTAQSLGLPREVVLGVHGFGSGAGNAIALQNIIAGGATVGLSGQEGQVLRRTLPVCLLYTALGGVIAFWLVE